MRLSESIKRNQVKQARYRRAEKTLRQIRLRLFDYEDISQEKYTKAQRVMETCKRILAPLWDCQRRSAQARKLESTPSAFEPGIR